MFPLHYAKKDTPQVSRVAPKVRPEKISKRFSTHASTPLRCEQPRLNQDRLMPPAPVEDVLKHQGTDVSRLEPYLAKVVRCQNDQRVCRKETALMVGGTSGVVGLFFGALAGPFFPVVGATAALVGGAVGAAFPAKKQGSFQQVRKHMFYKIGIVPTRIASANIVASLKKEKVLEKGRNRTIVSLEHLDACLAKHPSLSADARKQVRACLELIQQEALHFDALVEEQARLDAAMTQARLRGVSAQELGALSARKANIKQRLAGYGSGAPMQPQHLQIEEA